MEAPELRGVNEIAEALEGKAKEPTVDPRDSKEYTFKVNWTSPRGETFAGEFTNRILSFGDRRRKAVLRSQLLAGQPAISFEFTDRDRETTIAHLKVSLVKFPKWAEDLDQLFDEELLYVIWEEVASHEARFFRLAAPAERSEECTTESGG